jgi:hypothetical protein
MHSVLVKCIVELLTAIAKAIMALISLFIEWIWAVIRGMMEVVIKPNRDGTSN